MAFDDGTFNVTGNVRIQVPDGTSDLLANDIDPDTGNNTNLTLNVETKKSAQCVAAGAGCAANNVTIAADGSFTFNPMPGFEGADSFTYTVRDRGADGVAGNSDDTIDTATVNLNVSGMVWFVQNGALPARRWAMDAVG
jgi:hypothetical protein